ncbi:MAG TPA: DUF819 family protein [Sphingomonadaceae bacterium]|nr:DUF819 family protein [Sphingomonadaceae bacterium]
MTLIAADDAMTLSAFLLVLTFIGFWADNHPIAKRTSGVLWIIVGGMLLSNLKVVPFDAPTYGFVFSVIVPAAIPLLLFKANFRKIVRETGKMLLVFLLGSVTIMIGAAIGYLMLNLGPLGAKVAGVYTGGWIGGAVSFVAVADAVELTKTDFAAAISASAPVSVFGLMALVSIPAIGFIRRNIPTRFDPAEAGDLAIEAEPAPFRSVEVAGLLALSLVICAVSHYLAELIHFTSYTIVIVTCLSLLVANVFPRQMERFRTDFDLGMFLMYVFFACIGMTTDATAFIQSALSLFIFGMAILLIHFALMLLAARLLKIDLAEAVIASAANVVGPAPAAAIASARGWQSLVTPGVMCGIFGKSIGTFIGIGVTMLLR